MQISTLASRTTFLLVFFTRSVSIMLVSLILTLQTFLLVSPVTVYAQPVPGITEDAVPLGDYLKLSDSTKVSEVYSTPAFLVNLIVRNLFVVAGIILLVIGLYAGFQYITGGRKGMDNAKQMLTAATVGFLLMFSAYWIIQIIKIVTGADILL